MSSELRRHPRCNCSTWILGLTLFVSGCGQDLKQTADFMIEADMQQHRERVAAVEFFEAGGSYRDDKEEGFRVDQSVLVPLLRKLSDQTNAKPWVVPSTNDRNRAFSVLVEIPEDDATEEAMARIVEEADAGFDGLILQQWGHHWLSLDFLDKESVEFFKKTDPDFEKQR